MRDKRKDIIRDLLGDFAEEENTEEDIPQEEEKEIKRKPRKEIPDDEDDAFELDKIINSPSKKKTKKIKKVSDVMKAEIIEEGLVPNYNVTIPSFSANERQLFNEIREKLVEVAVTQDDFKVDEDSFIGEVKQFLRAKGVRDVDRLSAQISQEMLGYGKLDHMIKDDDLEEVMVIGTGSKVFVYHRKIGMMITNVAFDDEAEIKAIIDVIARQVNRRIDQQTPILDARLKDGSRVNATIPPVSADGPTLTIRKFRKDPLTVIDLINY